MMVAAVTTNALVELELAKYVHKLGEHGSAFDHRGLSARLSARKHCEVGAGNEIGNIMITIPSPFYRNAVAVSSNLTGQ